MEKSANIYLLKGDRKKIRKAIAIITRILATWMDTFPLDPKEYFAFQLNDKLIRKIKISKLQNKLTSKKLNKLYTLVNNCKRFDTFEDFKSYKEKNKKPYTYKIKNANLDIMPKPNKKDNQTISYGKSKWSEMTKEQLIKESRKINGSRVRKPRKSANKKKWINFLERFSNKRWDEKNE